MTKPELLPCFEFEPVERKPDVYRILIRVGGQLRDVFERQDCRGPFIAKIALFGISRRRHYIDFDNPDIDRFLFNNTRATDKQESEDGI